MAENLPVNIAIPPGLAITSYSFTDISEGTGIRAYNGANAYTTAGVASYMLTTQTPYSTTVTTSGACTGFTAYTKVIDNDFDVALNLPMDLKGNVFVTVTHSIASASATQTAQQYVYVKIRKYDGTTETEVASASGAVLLSPVGTANESATSKKRTDTLKIPVTSITHYAPGETFRCTVETWVALSNSGMQGVSRICHDPQNRNDPEGIIVVGSSGASTTKMQCYAPTLIDI